jgi:putative nucleotidyltransferase with HDIG domain
VPAPTDEDAFVSTARSLAEFLLGDVGSRWEHSRGVAARAATAAQALPDEQRPVLVAAAWLHDIGYARPLRRSGFHPLDGARYLQEHGWPPAVAGLVAHHSGAQMIAHALDLDEEMNRFPATIYANGPIADALTYADQTTAPDGRPVDVEDRLADMLRRHGPDSPNARCHQPRAALIRGAVRRTDQRLGRRPPP